MGTPILNEVHEAEQPVGPEPEKPAKASFARVLLLSVLVTVLNPLGNSSLSFGMKHVSKIVGLNPMDYVQAMLNPAAAMGVGLLILWLLMRMALMSWADLSFVLPVTSGGYALSALLGTFVLHEVVSPRQWAGIALIAGGAALAGSQQQRKVE